MDERAGKSNRPHFGPAGPGWGLAGLAAAALMLLALSAGSASAQEDFTFEGSGYGHGVGLSQWGGAGPGHRRPGKIRRGHSRLLLSRFPGRFPVGSDPAQRPPDRTGRPPVGEPGVGGDHSGVHRGGRSVGTVPRRRRVGPLSQTGEPAGRGAVGVPTAEQGRVRLFSKRGATGQFGGVPGLGFLAGGGWGSGAARGGPHQTLSDPGQPGM